MNKEEKEAIEILSYFETDDLSEYAMYCNALNVIKNLIQKQEKIINDIKFITYNNKPHITQEKLIEYFKKEVERK